MRASPSIKQLEALYWIAQLGTFERAASHLNTTQSAISKRIQELEGMSDEPLFDRTARSARLTVRGRALLGIAASMLSLKDRAVEVLDSASLPRGRFRLGVTEMTALTWLPEFVLGLQTRYPDVKIEPEVEASETLFGRLQQDQVDLIVVPDIFHGPRFESIPIGEVVMHWMCSPQMQVAQGRIPIGELVDMTILAQDMRSGSGLIYRRWLEDQGVTLGWTVSSNSLIALMGLTVAGLGISYLPEHSAQPLIESGRLRILDVDPPLPPLPYVAMLRSGVRSTYETRLIEEIRQACDFNIPIFGRTEDRTV